MKKQGFTGVLLLIVLLVYTACSGNEKNSEVSSHNELSVVTSSMQSSLRHEASTQESEQKNIKLSVINGEKETETFEIATDAENLRTALEQAGLIEGDESEFGLFVTSVNGIAADSEKQEWWCLTKGGEMWSYGVDFTELSDGDVFEFSLTKGY